MPINLARYLPLAIVAVAVVPPGRGAYIGAYAAMLLSLVGLALHGWRQRHVLLSPPVVAVLAGLVLVSLTVPFVYKTPADLMALVILLPMLCAVGLAVSAFQDEAVPRVGLFASLCVLGAGLAFFGGVFDILFLDGFRPGLGNNPIHYASLAALVGGMGILGVTEGRLPWRHLFLLGPVFGISAAAISGSRGPLMGAVAMAAVSCPFLIVWFWRERTFRWATIVIATAALLAVAMLIWSGNYRALGVFDSAINIFRLTGGGDDIRAAMYISSIHALLASPVYGYGFGQLMDTARAMFPDMPYLNDLEHLHADWADFAVMAGGSGLVAYFLFLAAPLLILVAPRARADRALVLGAMVLAVGQAALGASNAVFGVLPQTVLYAVMLGYLIARARLVMAGQPRETGSRHP